MKLWLYINRKVRCRNLFLILNKAQHKIPFYNKISKRKLPENKLVQNKQQKKQNKIIKQ